MEIKQVEMALRNSKGYATVSYIIRISGLHKEDVTSILKSNKQFRKSFIIHNGEDVYMLNTRWSLLKDIWTTFQHINYLKY